MAKTKLQVKGANIKFKELLDIDVVGIERPREELLALRGRLAKEANRRMTMLENSKSEISGQPYTYGAYEHYAVRYLKGAKQKRFGRLRKSDDKNLVHEINVLQKFLKAPSSLVSNMKKFEKNAQKSFHKMGLKRTYTKSFYEFITSGAWQEMRKVLPSEEIISFVAGVADNAKDYKRMMKLMRDYMQQVDETSVDDFKNYVNSRWNKSI